ncbi:hypothetical protein EPZ47_26175 [Pseudomonas viciae]|uniref:Uncharacterized protein n=1 Tax=Pseudomonas viciae TaxID=2505979 RepID=A0A4P7PM66_9PSED|nr:hypothetical protein EPZ47_26175 [Pseudomonas viciae]
MSCVSSANSHVAPDRTPSRASSLPQGSHSFWRNSVNCGSGLAREGRTTDPKPSVYCGEGACYNPPVA